MKLSFLPVSLYDEFRNGKRTLAEWARQGMPLGLDGIDVSVAMVESIDDKKMIGIGKEIADNGNKIAMYTTYTDYKDLHEKGRK